MTALKIPPVVKSVRVSRTPADAFRAFTEELDAWWPHKSHSLGADQVKAVVMECRHGGQIYELWKDGSKRLWGTIGVWEPPHRLSFSWHVGRDPQRASEVRLTFTAAGDGTVVELVHDQWEKMGDGARAVRDGYDSGWVAVFERCFGAHATRPDITVVPQTTGSRQA